MLETQLHISEKLPNPNNVYFIVSELIFCLAFYIGVFVCTCNVQWSMQYNTVALARTSDMHTNIFS